MNNPTRDETDLMKRFLEGNTEDMDIHEYAGEVIRAAINDFVKHDPKSPVVKAWRLQ